MITIRVDEAERSLFNEAARAVGISVSEYARDAMLARMLLAQEQGVVEPRVVRREGVAAKVPPPPPQVTGTTHSPAMIIHGVSSMIKSTGDVPAAVERVASSRVFRPDPKGAKPRAEVKPVVTASTCRHGLMRCKVCGSG